MRAHKKVHDVTVSDSEVLTTAQLADLLGIHQRTLLRLRARGDGPPVIKIGRIYRYRRVAVEEWLHEQVLSTRSCPAG
jgi:excisionase family DNA binding protein